MSNPGRSVALKKHPGETTKHVFAGGADIAFYVGDPYEARTGHGIRDTELGTRESAISDSRMVTGFRKGVSN
jgi:hypothetical protein